MAFETHIVEANLTLGRIYPEDLPSLACDALEAGYDGPAIRRIAGLIKPSGWESDQLIPQFMAETKMRLLPANEAAVRVAYDMARQLIDERKDPLDFVKEFSRLWIESDFNEGIQSLGMMDDQVDLGVLFGQSDEQIRNSLRDTLIHFLRAYEGLRPPSDQHKA